MIEIEEGIAAKNKFADRIAVDYNNRVETTRHNGDSQTQPCQRSAAILGQASLVVTNHSPAAAKIKLFGSLFRGREDVYPRRFESRKTGKSGYAPACANEWVRGVCEKPRIKCTDCPNRRFFQITGEVIGWHLSGRDDRGLDFVIGVYAMLLEPSESQVIPVCAFICARPKGEAAASRVRSRQME